jgi:hypothetical protein
VIPSVIAHSSEEEPRLQVHPRAPGFWRAFMPVHLDEANQWRTPLTA